jgi:hypothetical protein
MIQHTIETRNVDVEITLICDMCSSKQSEVLPDALVWQGRVICAKCLPENITENIKAYLYNKCDQEGCEGTVFKFRGLPTCFPCLEKINMEKRRRHKEEFEAAQALGEAWVRFEEKKGDE